MPSWSKRYTPRTPTYTTSLLPVQMTRARGRGEGINTSSYHTHCQLSAFENGGDNSTIVYQHAQCTRKLLRCVHASGRLDSLLLHDTPWAGTSPPSTPAPPLSNIHSYVCLGGRQSRRTLMLFTIVVYTYTRGRGLHSPFSSSAVVGLD